MVIILLLASAVRIVDLDTRSLWADEGWTLVLSEGPSVSDITQHMAYDQHPPLYFVLIHQWQDATGSSELSLRMLSVLTGLVAVAGIYQLGRTMFSPMAGLLAALIFGLWDHHIDLSQDVRHYSQLATLIVLSCWFYFRFISMPYPKRGTRIGYIVISSALLYSHYLGGFVLICQLIHMLIFVRPLSRLRWVIFHFAAICATFLPWFPVVIRQNQVRWETPLYYLNALPNTAESYALIRDALLSQQYGLISVLIIIGLLGLSLQSNSSIYTFRHFRSIFFLVFWSGGYFMMTYILNRPGREFLTIRNFIVITPALVLLMAYGLMQLELRLRAIITVVLVSLMLGTVDTRQLKPPWREVFQNVATYHQADEPILMDIWVGDFPGRYYIEQQTGADTEWLSLREARDDYAAQFLPVVKGYVQEYDAFWLVFWRSVPVDEMPYAEGFAEAGFQRTVTRIEKHVGNNIYAYRYDRVTGDHIAQFWADDSPLIALQDGDVNEVGQAGETLQIRLLFAAIERPTLDYSVSVFLSDENGALVAPPQDAPPQNGEAPTSQWEPGQLIFDQHILQIPETVPAGNYTVGVRIYYYLEPSQPLQTCFTEDNCTFAVIGEVEIEGE